MATSDGNGALLMSAEPGREHAMESSRHRSSLDEVNVAPSSAGSGPVTESRRKVIAATIDLIERRTYRSVTVDAVVRAAGVSKSTIYRHWPTREVLVLEAFAHRTNVLTNVPDSGDALADLHTYLSKLATCLEVGGAASTVAGLVPQRPRRRTFCPLVPCLGFARPAADVCRHTSAGAAARPDPRGH